MFRTLSTDGTEQDQVLFNEASRINIINCIDHSGCLDNEICVKHGDTDVGTCQCPLGFKRNIAGMFWFYSFVCNLIECFQILYIFLNLYHIRIFFNIKFILKNTVLN